MKNAVFLFFCFLSISLFGQEGSISGIFYSEGETVPFASIIIKGTNIGTLADENGYYELNNIPFGEYVLQTRYVGLDTQERTVVVSEKKPSIQVDFDLIKTSLIMDPIVVTGTKTFKRKTQSPVIVNIIDGKTLNNVQACNLSEGLRFQPGLRVETDCQTCNYTQLRMNGLGGGYSQILINGRPIFSPLTGLYGMEQVPTNMIERIEVVRGGGSALYGSMAIGGTVNVITKIPEKSGYDISYTYQNIRGNASDHILNGNATVLTKNKQAGASFFVNSRTRNMYDHNGDNFSELPELKNNSFGTNLFFQPNRDQKIELSLSSLNEYRYGGEMVDKAPHLALQSEDRTHNVVIGNVDYQINFNQDNSSFIAYLAAQHTKRKHYTGIFPDDSTEIQQHISNPPYGTSENTTYQGGVQYNHRIRNFLWGSNVLTMGMEYIADDVLDVIDPYNYKVDQFTQNYGLFLQSDWEIIPSLNLLSGVRMDKHNLVDNVIFSPRLSLLYKLKSSTQFRFTWSTGFRAPQAFDSDLHIAFAGGGISRINLSPDLHQERSNSISGSINFDKATEHIIAGFTVEGFYTHLNDAFYLHPLGQDAFGERFEKRNGDGATVKGATIEFRANYDQKIQLETGFTFQSSLFDVAVENIEGLESKREFLRTPNQYGYSTLTITPYKTFNTTLNLVYTGKMELAHFAGSPEQTIDEYVTSSSFTELSIRSGYTFEIDQIDTGIELFGGVKNIGNAYQNDFDTGKNRDSNYVYGPAMPRTYFVGLKVKSL